ncbi:hypothetical protein Tco_1134722 [Tanacetum coccineum]
MEFFVKNAFASFVGKVLITVFIVTPKVPIISNPEQCNQTINELPQILPNVHPTCNYEDENPFISDFKPHSFNVSPSVFNQPPQLQFETYLCELCGNNAHYGYDCSPQFLFRGEEIDEEYERDCEIRIRKLKQDFNIWGSEVRKKEQAYEEEKYSAACLNSTPDRVLNSPSPFPIPVADSDSFLEESDTSFSHLDNSLPEFETFSDHTEETRSGSTTTHANYSLPEYDSFLFEIELDQEGLINIDNSNNTLLGSEFESYQSRSSFPDLLRKTRMLRF